MDTQVISFASILGTSDPAVGRKVTAKPAEGQFIDQSLLDRQVLAGTTDAQGQTSLTLVVGATYEVSVSGWGAAVITVNTEPGTVEAPYPFATYLAEGQGEVVSAAGVGIATSMKCQNGSILQVIEIDNGDGTWSWTFTRVA